MSNENKDSSVGGVGGCGLEETDTDLDTLLDGKEGRDISLIMPTH